VTEVREVEHIRIYHGGGAGSVLSLRKDMYDWS